MSWRVENLEVTALVGYGVVKRHARPLVLIELGLHRARLPSG